MTQVVPRRGRVGDYVISAVGLVPLVLGAPQPVRFVDNQSSSALYRTDLVRGVQQHLDEVQRVVRLLAASSPASDFAFVEGPDHAPYADAYAWEVVEVDVADAGPLNYGDFDAPELWR